MPPFTWKFISFAHCSYHTAIKEIKSSQQSLFTVSSRLSYTRVAGICCIIEPTYVAIYRTISCTFRVGETIIANRAGLSYNLSRVAVVLADCMGLSEKLSYFWCGEGQAVTYVHVHAPHTSCK